MRTSLKTLLSIGDKRTTGASNEVVQLVNCNNTLLGELVSLLDNEDDGIRMRSFDALEKLMKTGLIELSEKETDRILQIGFDSDQQEVLWHWCQIVPRLRLSPQQIEEVYSHMNSLRGSKSKIVWAFALQGMFDISSANPKFKSRTSTALKEDLKTGSAAVKARCRKLLMGCSK